MKTNMRKKNLKILLLITIISFCIKSNAQKNDFIVTYSNDTIYVDQVWIKFDNIKVKKDGKKTKFLLEEIKSLYKSKDESYYEKIDNPNAFSRKREKVFAERLTDGKINFYYYHIGDGGMTGGYSYYFISKNGRMSQLSNFGTKSFYKEIKRFINDDKEVLSELNSIKKIKMENLIKLIKKYNSKIKNI
ncbi:hypothetical protein [Polaribacter sp. Q13]|uniref:hypothetical protein n=1 Tax=Polaribacter sp. Q13 TaxID=2806551 RepID=UPI001C015E73|nr:hypothetical protein [Polaribacter sp. Q13]QVY66845.1 hypothetical protein JOP69_06070 [Polaribacter sp. Q13]